MFVSASCAVSCRSLSRLCLLRSPCAFSTDDDIDLYVAGPSGEALWYGNTFDNITEAVFITSDDYLDLEDTFDTRFHMESAIYPEGMAMNGEYFFFIDVWNQTGLFLDEWKVELVDPITNTNIIYTGVGYSETFTYFRSPDVLGFARGDATCEVQKDVECCDDSDCTGSSGGQCFNFVCVEEPVPGAPQFLLTWFGGEYQSCFCRPFHGIAFLSLLFSTGGAMWCSSFESVTVVVVIVIPHTPSPPCLYDSIHIVMDE